MISRRPSDARGRTQIDWLDSRHTFSFAEYVDADHMGFRALRVINEDWVEPNRGFGTHAHQDMEIVTWVVDGALEHKDSLGNGSIIRPGDAQRMTAGRGIRHSEFNASLTTPVHLLQIWILPDRRGLDPGYEQRTIPAAELRGQLRVVAARDGRDGAVTIHQDVTLYATVLEPEQRATLELAPGRHAWVQVVRGHLSINGTALASGDGGAISAATRLDLAATTAVEALVFDLA